MTTKLKGDQLWVGGPYLDRRGGSMPARTESCAHKAFFAIPVSGPKVLKGVLWCNCTFALLGRTIARIEWNELRESVQAEDLAKPEESRERVVKRLTVLGKRRLKP